MTISTPRSPEQAIARLIADTSPYLSCDECFERLDEYVESLSLTLSTPMPRCRSTCAAAHSVTRKLTPSWSFFPSKSPSHNDTYKV